MIGKIAGVMTLFIFFVFLFIALNGNPALFVVVAIPILIFLAITILLIRRYRKKHAKSKPASQLPADNSTSRILGKTVSPDPPKSGAGIVFKKPKQTGDIFLDSNIALDILSGKYTPDDHYMSRMALSDVVKHEVNTIIKHNPEKYDTARLPALLKDVKNGKDFTKYVSTVERIQQNAIDDYKGDKATLWLDAKKLTLEKNHGIAPQYLQASRENDGQLCKDALQILYNDAKRDREIIASAASNTNDGATLATHDADILLFAEEVSVLTGEKLAISKRWSRL